MNKLEQQLLHEATSGVEPRLCIRSGTHIDAGRWWKRTPVWLVITGEELLMLAVARRRYAAGINLADCGDTHYNHGTGELVIEPGETLEINRIALSPSDALRVLHFLKSNTQH